MALGEVIAAPRVGQVVPGSPAAAAGFLPGDLIRSINGRAVDEGADVTEVVMLSAGDPLRFTVDRAGREVQLTATPVRQVEDNAIAGRVRIARIGLSIQPLRSDIQFRRLNPIEAAGRSVERIGSTISGTATYVGRIFVGKESGDLLNGPIGIAKAAGGITQQSAAASDDPTLSVLNVLINLIQLAALISIGVGIVNLLPIPVLDGGHLLFYGYEAVARRPVPARVQEVGYRVGLALLAGLMLFATWNDLQKLSLFKFLGGLA
jgi:regulator of sigma E protease